MDILSIVVRFFAEHTRQLLRQILDKHIVEPTDIYVQLLCHCQFSLLSEWKSITLPFIRHSCWFLIMCPKSVPFFVVNCGFCTLISTFDSAEVALSSSCLTISKFFLEFGDTTLESLYLLLF
jgi:hypothetical protein